MNSGSNRNPIPSHADFHAERSKMIETLERRLEQIRQEQLAQCHARLRTLRAEQEQSVEVLTLAILRRILGEITNGSKASAQLNGECNASEIVSLIWGLGENPSGLRK